VPHQVQARLIKRRLIGKDGSERLRELRLALAQLPDYKNGPYADLRKWVMAAEIDAVAGHQLRPVNFGSSNSDSSWFLARCSRSFLICHTSFVNSEASASVVLVAARGDLDVGAAVVGATGGR